MSTPVIVYMYVRPDTLPPVAPKCRLSEDPNRPTPLLTQVTVLDNATSDSGTYSTSTFQAVASITAAEWANMCTLINNKTQQTQVTITYDDSISGTSKPLIGGPVFTAVPLAHEGLLAHVANAIHAAEERVESGVSGELREDIKHTRATVDSLAATVAAIKAKVDKL
jgi:hypothetical protein